VSKIRKYICAECGSNLDRDYNVAENIIFEEIKKYMERLV
jgi:transposase